ncbi:MAG: sigma-54-dependent Fis family transcriptional regulator [Candidatus Marinimicrobia bacterium]|nr:sigma-54-dependent Fis family transcriptional regulator [Candidatus Neomarinimicrobiota bacterium]
MLRINRTLDRICDFDNPVLISGEAGTGKALIASILHERSKKSQSNFIKFDSSGVPKSHIKSNLFGSLDSTGKYTMGLLSEANNGTLLIKNAELLPQDAQSNLMSIISNGEYFIDGISEPKSVEIRIICTTEKKISQLSEEGTISMNLLNVLSEYHIHLPPLRERLEDIPELVNQFVKESAEELSIPVPIVNVEFLEMILREKLPGNASQLRNMIKTSLAMSEKGELEIDNLPNSIIRDKPDYIKSLMSEMKTATARKYKKFLSNIEEQLLKEALTDLKYNQVKVAKLFGVDESTLRRKMDRYGIPRKRMLNKS